MDEGGRTGTAYIVPFLFDFILEDASQSNAFADQEEQQTDDGECSEDQGCDQER